MKDIYQILAELNIPYVKHEHPPLFTVEEADKYHDIIPGAHTKNLFLRNKKGDVHYLVVVESQKRVDLGELRKTFDESKLSFASPEKLNEYLGLTPGSVSAFGLINDESKTVRVVVDNDLMGAEKIGFHPNINTATLTISTNDFRKFLEWTGNDVAYQNIPQR